MEFTKDTVRNMAETMHLALNDDEVNEVFKKVIEFSGHIDTMLAVDVEGFDPYIISTTNTNVFQTKEPSEQFDCEHLKSTLNDFDGEYFIIKKVMDDE